MSGWFRRWSRPATPPRTVILLYHRVAATAIDPWGLSVSPERFDEQLRVLARKFEIVPLEEALTAALSRRTRVAITFDDGYADNLYNAEQILVGGQAVATVFCCSRMVDGTQFWWDQLAHWLLASPLLPGEVSIRIGERDLVFQFDGRVAPSVKGWRAWHEARTEAERAFVLLWNELKDRSEHERERALDLIRQWTAGSEPSKDLLARPLTREEIARLAAGGTITIGSHGRRHEALSRLTPAEQQVEIGESRRELESVTGRAVDVFAYPFGHEEDFTPETVRLVQEAGYRLACTSMSGAVEVSESVHRLRRLHVSEWSGEELLGKIKAVVSSIS